MGTHTTSFSTQKVCSTSWCTLVVQQRKSKLLHTSSRCNIVFVNIEISYDSAKSYQSHVKSAVRWCCWQGVSHWIVPQDLGIDFHTQGSGPRSCEGIRTPMLSTIAVIPLPWFGV